MFIRWNDTSKLWEKDTSGPQDGSGPWTILPIDGSQIGQGNINVARMPTGGQWVLSSVLDLSTYNNVRISGTDTYDAVLEIWADRGDDPSDRWEIRNYATGNLLAIRNSGADKLALDTSGNVSIIGGLTAGSGAVGIINSVGRIPAISATYFTDLNGASITNIQESNIADGTVYPRIASTETISGAWTFSNSSSTFNGTVNAVGGANYSGVVVSITVVNGIVTNVT